MTAHVTLPAEVLAAIVAIDRANGLDPNLVEFDGDQRPKELVHADRMEAWVRTLDPDAGPAQILAARAHHFQRWLSPRADYPEGRNGYLRWRRDARRRHVADVELLLEHHGVDRPIAQRCLTIIAKDGLGVDPVVQTHEDALCLTFFELQGEATATQLGERAGDVVAKTLAKMSPAAREVLGDVPLSQHLRSAIAAAPSGPSGSSSGRR